MFLAPTLLLTDTSRILQIVWKILCPVDIPSIFRWIFAVWALCKAAFTQLLSKWFVFKVWVSFAGAFPVALLLIYCPIFLLAKWERLSPSDQYVLGKPMYFQAEALPMSHDERLYIHSCYATPEKSHTFTLRFPVVRNFG